MAVASESPVCQSLSSQRDGIVSSSACYAGNCACRCHRTSKISTRFWSIEYSLLSTMFASCDRVQCKARVYRQSCWVTLSRLGIPLALVAGLECGRSVNGYQISPSLYFTPVVPYTSPGFQVLWKAEKGLISSSEAEAELHELFIDRKASVRDVDPAGDGWLEVRETFNQHDIHSK